jgi:hypothetical protein
MLVLDGAYLAGTEPPVLRRAAQGHREHRGAGADRAPLF